MHDERKIKQSVPSSHHFYGLLPTLIDHSSPIISVLNLCYCKKQCYYSLDGSYRQQYVASTHFTPEHNRPLMGPAMGYFRKSPHPHDGRHAGKSHGRGG